MSARPPRVCTHPPAPAPPPTPAEGQGKIRQTLFPPLPRRLLYGPRADFSFPKTQVGVGLAL